MESPNAPGGARRTALQSSSELASIRNIGIFAHIDAGKTTTTERVLFVSGVVPRVGAVDSGSATTDWMRAEQDRGISITAAATTCWWRGCHINLIDTPGHVDFGMEVHRALRVLDGMVVVLDGTRGVEPQTESVWRLADARKIPRIVLVNKMDRPGADALASAAMLRERVGASPVLLQLRPDDADFEGVLDLVSMAELRWEGGDSDKSVRTGAIRPELLTMATDARETLISTVADKDEETLERWVTGSLDADSLRAGIRRAALRGAVVPVYLGAAARGVGVEPILDGVVDYLPSPAERRERPTATSYLTPRCSANSDDTKSERVFPADDGPFVGLAFKEGDVVRGNPVTFIRIYRGRVEPGTKVYNSVRDELETIDEVVRIQASSREMMSGADAGDIVGLVGLRHTRMGDTLCDPDSPVRLDGIVAPEPVISVLVDAADEDSERRLDDALAWLHREDPSIEVSMDGRSGRRVVSGQGELHLVVALQRLRDESGLVLHSTRPQVNYTEQLQSSVQVDRTTRATGGPASPFVGLQVDFSISSDRLHVEVEASGEPLPADCAEAIRDGVGDGAAAGGKGGYPLTNLSAKVRVESRPDSEFGPLPYRVAAKLAVLHAVEQAGTKTLEPWMRVTVVVPVQHVGDVLADLQARRGRVEDVGSRANARVITAEVPLVGMLGYSTAIRSITQGRATHTMEYAYQAPVPGLNPEVRKTTGW